MFDNRPDRSAEIVLVGRSNVGKSTLMRLLTGHAVDTGRRPGVTTAPTYFDWASADLLVTDLPGFGFMSGISEERREEIKTGVVRYIESNADHIVLAMLVLDGKAAVEIIDRHRKRGDIPHDVELFDFLTELQIPTLVVVNKMDKVDDRDERLDEITERLGLYPPWQQWQDMIVPISAKREQLSSLKDAVEAEFTAQGKTTFLGPLNI